MNNEKSQSEINSEDLSLGRIFRLLLLQSKLIVLIILTITGLGIYNFISADRVYQVKSLLQVLPGQRSPYAGSEMDFFLGSQNTTDLSVIEQLYRSRSNMLDVIESNAAHIEYDDKTFDKQRILKFLKTDSSSAKFNVQIDFNNESYEVFDEIDSKGVYAYDTDNQIQGFELNFSNPEKVDNELINFSYRSPSSAHKEFSRKFSIKSLTTANTLYGFRNSGLIEVIFTTKHPDYGINLLNYANKMFIENNIKSEAETARKAIDFIDQRLLLVEKTLINDKESLKVFREENKTVDVDLEIESIVNTLTKIESRIADNELEIARATVDYTSSNPIYLDLLREKDALFEQKNIIEEKVKNLPLSQQEFIDLFRQVEISQTEYDELQLKKLELSIKEASTLGNIKIIDEAFVDDITSPSLISVILSFLISGVIALFTAIIRGIYFLPITNPAELPDSSINTPIIGVLPNCDGDVAINDERFTQSIESLLVNIEKISEMKSYENRAVKILITSPTATNGKSFVSRELAKKLAIIGKKVLLADNDWKRGDQHKEFKIDKINQRDFENLTESNIEELKVSENLYVIPKLSKLSSSFQFLNSPSYKAKISMLTNNFDFIIFDTAPILSVSDTSMLASLSDINFCVVRHSLTKLNEIHQVIAISSQIGLTFDGIIYNAFKKPSSYYGYYSLYGNYNYQYYAKKYLYTDYDYENEK